MLHWERKKIRKIDMKGSFKAMFLICLLVLMGCGKEIPNDIIQPDEMEKVLYDYQIVTAI